MALRPAGFALPQIAMPSNRTIAVVTGCAAGAVALYAWRARARGCATSVSEGDAEAEPTGRAEIPTKVVAKVPPRMTASPDTDALVTPSATSAAKAAEFGQLATCARSPPTLGRMRAPLLPPRFRRDCRDRRDRRDRRDCASTRARASMCACVQKTHRTKAAARWT